MIDDESIYWWYHFLGLVGLVLFLLFFFFLGFRFFMMSTCISLRWWEMVQGSSKRNTFLLSLTSIIILRATESGIQLFLKLYLAMEELFLMIESSSFSIFYSRVSPRSSLALRRLILTSARLSFSKVSAQLLTALRTSQAPSFYKELPINFKVLSLQLMFARIYWIYFTPFWSMPQKFKDSFSIRLFCLRPTARWASPSFFIQLLSSFSFLMLFLSEHKVLPRNSHPKLVILLSMRSKYSTDPTLSMQAQMLLSPSS